MTHCGMSDFEVARYRADLEQAHPAERVEALLGLMSALAWRHRAGDPRALWEALFTCFDFRAPAPDWVRDAMREAYGRYAEAEVKDLGDAFGLARPKGWHRAPERARKAPDAQGLTRIYKVATAMHAELAAGHKVISETFARVAKALDLTQSEVKEIWYDLPADLRHPRP